MSDTTERHDDELPAPPTAAEMAANRRDFLRLAGFAFAGAALSGCAERPVEQAVPFLHQPEAEVPGQPLWYASTCAGCEAGCGMLVKCLGGRPIKLEGNPQHPLSRGGLCAVGQASLLGVYDSRRLRGPLVDGQAVTWEAADQVVTTHLADLRRSGGAVRLLTGSSASPTLRAVTRAFLAGFADARQVTYDPLPHSAIAEAHRRTHGLWAVPAYRFDQADVVAGFECDFLGTWLSPVEHTAGYQAARSLDGTPPRLSYVVQFESRVSLTGTKADRRVSIGPAEAGLVLTGLAEQVARLAGVPFESGSPGPSPVPAADLADLAGRLWAARGRSLVVCGVQDVQVQILVNFLNHLLGNYGGTVDLQARSYQRQGREEELLGLLDELRQGKVASLLIGDVNPLAELPGADEWRELLATVPLVVSFSRRLDETSRLAGVVCPDHEPLESWSDAEPVNGLMSLAQPALTPLWNTRAVGESLSLWAGEAKSAYQLVRGHWQAAVYRRREGPAGERFEVFWNRALQDGYVRVARHEAAAQPFDAAALVPLDPEPTPAAGALSLVLYPKVGLRDGRHAYNAWLQELPDPISKATWDNYACLSPGAAAGLGVAQGDVVRLEAPGVEPLELPVYVQPGQHDGTVAVALGYGREETARFANLGPHWLLGQPCVGPNGRVGVNAAPLRRFVDGLLTDVRHDVRLTPSGRHRPLALTQVYDLVDVPANLAPEAGPRRPVIQETALAAYLRDPAAGAAEDEGKTVDLWPPDHRYPAHHWAMVIDLNACTGCAGCVVACQIENNIPVVGRDEVRRRRDLHWLRIDRYYTEEKGSGVFSAAHQPMLCHHCDNAPCEVVCPVLATVHSEEGLNQQVYNRCVGTRYCANNCPYKVRRFNWFDYPHQDEVENLVLNPEVTVRSRGVMEKCTFCVQRIEAARVAARRRGVPLADGDVQPACAQSCPAKAIIFGDRNDPNSAVTRAMHDPRGYQLLGELNLKPSVGYLRIVRHEGEEGEVEGHG